MNGFIPLPSYFFSFFELQETWILWYPKYEDAAYSIIDESEVLSDDLIKENVRKPIIYKSMMEDGFVPGILSAEDSFFRIVPFENMGVETIYEKENLKRIQFNESPDNKSLNMYSYLFSKENYSLDPTITDIEVNGDTVNFKVSVHTQLNADSIFKDAANNKAKMLRMIAKPLLENPYGFKNSKAKLGKFLHQSLEESDFNSTRQTKEIFPIVAGGIVKSVSCEKTKDYDLPDFDQMENDEIIKIFESDPWETWQITVQVTDAAWVEHLASVKNYYKFELELERDAAEWTGEPLRFS